MGKTYKDKDKKMPRIRLGAEASTAVTRRKAGPHKHRNTPKGGSKKVDYTDDGY